MNLAIEQILDVKIYRLLAANHVNTSGTLGHVVKEFVITFAMGSLIGLGALVLVGAVVGNVSFLRRNLFPSFCERLAVELDICG